MNNLCSNLTRGLVVSGLILSTSATAEDLVFGPGTAHGLDLHINYQELALNDQELSVVPGDKTAQKMQVDFSEQHAKFKEPLFSGGKFHQYFGVGALALVGVTILAPKEEGGLHENAAKGAALLGAAAATSGLIYHWDDFHWEDGLGDPDNLHVLLGGLGTAGMLFAAAKGPEAPHAAVGALAGISMGIAVKMTW